MYKYIMFCIFISSKNHNYINSKFIIIIRDEIFIRFIGKY